MKITQLVKYAFVLLLVLLLAYLLLISARILLVLLIAIIVASAIRPIVLAISDRGIPLGLSILVVYVVLAISVALLSIVVLPPIVNQITQYIENDSRLAFHIIRAQRITENLIADVTNSEVSIVEPERIREAVSDFVGQIRRTIPSVLDDISATMGEAVLIVVMGAYWLSSHKRATAFMTGLAPIQQRTRAIEIIEQMENTMGSYVRGVVTVALIVGLLNFVVMLVLSVPNAITLAIIIGITSTIPMIGGLVGIGLAALVTLVAAPQYLPGVLAISLIIQQLEAYYLSPRVMADRVGIDPLLVIVYTAIGFVIFGIVGALVAVPIMSAVHILIMNIIIEPYKDSMQHVEMEDGLPLITAEQELET